MKMITRDQLQSILLHRKVFGFWRTLQAGLVVLLTHYVRDGFDHRYGTDTSSVVSMLHNEMPALGQKVRSFPTHPRVIKHIIRSLDIDHSEFSFIDFGSGKGRAMLCASDFPFKRIVGVEWSEDLCAVARRNIGIYNSPRQKCFDLEVQCMNVLDYPFPESKILLYLYNPFGPEITNQVFAKVSRDAGRLTREFLMVFNGFGQPERDLVTAALESSGIEVISVSRTLTHRGSWLVAKAG
jgi:hypothetical protein